MSSQIDFQRLVGDFLTPAFLTTALRTDPKTNASLGTAGAVAALTIEPCGKRGKTGSHLLRIVPEYTQLPPTAVRSGEGDCGLVPLPPLPLLSDAPDDPRFVPRGRVSTNSPLWNKFVAGEREGRPSSLSLPGTPKPEAGTKSRGPSANRPAASPPEPPPDRTNALDLSLPPEPPAPPLLSERFGTRSDANACSSECRRSCEGFRVEKKRERRSARGPRSRRREEKQTHTEKPSSLVSSIGPSSQSNDGVREAFFLTDDRFALFARFGDWIPIRVSRKKYRKKKHPFSSMIR